MAVCTVSLPAFSADYCSPNVKQGRIDRIFWTRYGTADVLTDSTDASEWTTRLSNSTSLPGSGSAAPIRYAYVTGGWPQAEAATIDISLGRKVTGTPKHTLNLRIDDVSATNLTYVQTLANVTTRYRVWIESDGHLFGGDDGIAADLTFGNPVIPESNDELWYIPLQVTFEGALPTSHTSPITAA